VLWQPQLEIGAGAETSISNYTHDWWASGKRKHARSFVNPDSSDVAGRSSNKRWVSSIYFVNAAGLRPQYSSFVGLSNFPSFDRNYAGKERTHTSFGFF
jgi:hypothetical protein